MCKQTVSVYINVHFPIFGKYTDFFSKLLLSKLQLSRMKNGFVPSSIATGLMIYGNGKCKVLQFYCSFRPRSL